MKVPKPYRMIAQRPTPPPAKAKPPLALAKKSQKIVIKPSPRRAPPKRKPEPVPDIPQPIGG